MKIEVLNAVIVFSELKNDVFHSLVSCLLIFPFRFFQLFFYSRLLLLQNDLSSPLDDIENDVDILPPFKIIARPSRSDNLHNLKSFKIFLSIPGIWCVSCFLLAGSIPTGLFNVAVAPYLLQTYSIDGGTSGFYFLALGAVYAISVQFIGLLIDKG